MSNIKHEEYPWEAAKKRCEDIIELRPNYAEAYNNLAILYEKKNDYANALKNYAKAVNLQPNYVAAHHNLGLLFLKHSQLDEAIVQFKNVIELNPLSSSAHYYLANCFLGKNELDLAKMHYLEVLRFEPEHSDSLNNLGVVSLKKNEPQLAIDYFTKALAFDIDHEDAQNNLAATFMQYDRYENAARHYRDLLKNHPKNTEYHYNIAVAYMNLGHLEEAIEHFTQVLAADSQHVASLNNLAAIYWRLDRKDEAKTLLLKVLDIDPNNQNSHYLLSAATHREEYKKAPEDYVKNLFDNYAVQYNEHLCKELKYSLPERIGALLETLPSVTKELKTNKSALDLGCGTGLLGSYLKPYFPKICGVDLSQKMLDIAKKTEYYDQLFCDDIQSFLLNTSEQFELITAAEVFEYCGDLSTLFFEIAHHLKPQGLFVFSIESTQEKDFTLQETARFAHNSEYIHRLAKQSNLTILEEIPLSARLQNNQPLSSRLFLLERFILPK
jgi:predicted TPR repeat methyltransferase